VTAVGAGAVIVAARRTPVIPVPAEPAARQRFYAPHELAAPVLTALRAELDGGTIRVDDVVLGCARGPGGDVARIAALAGLGIEVPGVSVDRQCGSGLEAIRLAAALVSAGQADVVLAGGVESASTGPPGRASFAPAGFADPEMGAAAEELARRRGIDRERQDAYALRSHRLSAAAATEGAFDAELVPVAGVVRDERPRPRMDRALLARFPAAFATAGTVTAGNSCGISDGAAGVAVVSEAVRARLGLPGLRIVGSAVAGVDPALPGLGPVPAVRALVRRHRLDLSDVAVFEITEAFAAQVLACTDDLGLDPLGADGRRICPQGGAIGLGHPWGASGALLVVRLFAALVRAPAPLGRCGLATCAVGGGQGVAMLVERVV
jgi:acetyl-CoA C-acetyltransferase